MPEPLSVLIESSLIIYLCMIAETICQENEISKDEYEMDLISRLIFQPKKCGLAKLSTKTLLIQISGDL